MSTRRPARPPGKPSSAPGPSPELSTYPLDKLLILWKQGELTVEQLAGHLLQHQMNHEERLRKLESPAH